MALRDGKRAVRAARELRPAPRVDSAVVRMVPREAPAPVNVALLEELVQVAFSQRRKLLRHTLGRWLEARQFPAPSTPNAAPKKCPWTNTWHWHSRREFALKLIAASACGTSGSGQFDQYWGKRGSGWSRSR